MGLPAISFILSMIVYLKLIRIETTMRHHRQSNMELLRIVAMFLIVLFHCSFKSGFDFSSFTVTNVAIKTLWMGGELGVNLFMLVSGYFLINGKYKGNKLISLIVQVLFYWAVTVIAALQLGLLDIPNKRSAVLLLFPILTNQYWFVTAYIIIYIFTPWFNPFLKSLTKEAFLKLILVALVLWSFIPTGLGALNGQVEGTLYYSRLLWLGLIYVIGAYLKLHPLRAFSTMKVPFILVIASLITMVLSIILIGSHPKLFEKIGITEWAYFWPPNTIPMVALSLGVFGVFLNWRIPSDGVKLMGVYGLLSRSAIPL